MSGRYLKVFFTKTQDGNTTMMMIAELQVYDATGIIWGNGIVWKNYLLHSLGTPER